MNVGKSVGNILKIALLGACIYALLNWESIDPKNDESRDFAEHACSDEIRDRFTVTSVKAYAVDKTKSGYVVRASMTLARGPNAKVYCITNEHGGVEEIRTVEQ
jgi:hypothetical protein